MLDPSAVSKVEILLTGFKPFGEIDINPSRLIVESLRGHVETFNGREIRLIVYPEPLEVAYQSVFELVPGFKEKYPNVAYFVHLGVHEHAEKFRIERRARKGPYERKDVRGRSFDGPDDDGKWSTLPQELFTGVDVAALVETVKADVNTDKLEASDDAGLFLCEFIYYNSLVQTHLSCSNKAKAVDSIFFHVPVGLSSDRLKQGRDILLSIIRAMAT